MSAPNKEFHLCILGCTLVGKTSLVQRLNGTPFNRKHAAKSSMEDVATKYSIEVPTSNGIVLIHFYDWAWEAKRRDENINQQLMRGYDGAVFVYDVTDRRTLRDFQDYADWYQRAAGFDKPWVIVSNKNDQKKRAVQEGEGQSVASRGDNRSYTAISLVEDTGIDEFVLVTTRLMMKDVNLTLTGPFGPLSEISVTWSSERAAAATSNLGLGTPVVKSKRVLLVVLNRSVVDKFNDALVSTKYVLEVVGSAAMCEEEFAAVSAAISGSDDLPLLPIHAVLVPPTASEHQQSQLRELADRNGVAFVVSIPRNTVEAIEAASK